MGGHDLTGAVLENRYRILERIAEGAMGVVFGAYALRDQLAGDAPPIARDAGMLSVPVDQLVVVDTKPRVAGDDVLDEATQLLATGKTDAAIDLLLKARGLYPQHARIALTLGKLYFAKMWWKDGLANLRGAIAADPSLREDRELLELAVRAFSTTPSYDDRLGRFVVELGPSVKPVIEQAIAATRNPATRARLQAVLRRLR